MKHVTIRESAFETNSSSTHSISIARGEQLDQTIKPNGDGVIEIYDGEFGWEQEIYTSPQIKASYLVTHLGEGGDSGPEGEMLREVIKRHTRAKEVRFIHTGGYIDHQSQNVAEQAFVNKVALAEFLFCSQSILQTDNDNH